MAGNAVEAERIASHLGVLDRYIPIHSYKDMLQRSGDYPLVVFGSWHYHPDKIKAVELARNQKRLVLTIYDR